MKPKEKKTKSTFFSIFSGDFITHPKLVRWYPFFFLLIVLAIISVINEKSVEGKNMKIKNKQYEYKMALNQLKTNNHYLPYNQKKIIRDKATRRGFEENHQNMYKIPKKIISEVSEN